MTLTYEQKRQKQAIESLAQRLWLLERDYEETRVRTNRLDKHRCKETRSRIARDSERITERKHELALERSDALLDARASALREAPSSSDRV